MRLLSAILLLTFLLAAGIPACDCNSGYITSGDADATSSEATPAQ